MSLLCGRYHWQAALQDKEETVENLIAQLKALYAQSPYLQRGMVEPDWSALERYVRLYDR